ncbi:hypothetical protein HRbin12_01082 [bacterium HR12]|nr:hypothetical protein HRbin12_01082 [bacterium HR12]
MTTTAAPYRLIRRALARKSASPSLRLIEFTTALPCTHFSPASITSKREESIMIGTRAISGSVAMRFRKVVIAFTPSSRSASMLTSSMLAPLRTCSAAISTAPWKSPASMSRRKRAEPVTFWRSPIITNPVSGVIRKGSRPARLVTRSGAGGRRGGRPSTAWAICRMCSGVVPQQPPRMFASPASAYSRRYFAVVSGRSSYAPKALGRPAFGWQLVYTGATRARVSRCGRISAAPRAQFTPTLRGSACATEIQKASTVWPDKVRPLRSVMVTESMIGSSGATSLAATIAALALSVSKIVSMRRRSTPPSRSPSICSA